MGAGRLRQPRDQPAPTPAPAATCPGQGLLHGRMTWAQLCAASQLPHLLGGLQQRGLQLPQPQAGPWDSRPSLQSQSRRGARASRQAACLTIFVSPSAWPGPGTPKPRTPPLPSAAAGSLASGTDIEGGHSWQRGGRAEEKVPANDD